jgi:hypothetical protein
MIGNAVAGIYGTGAPPIPPSSYESIATANGTGVAGTITFSSIPATFKHLQIRCIAKDTFTAGGNVQEGWLQFNSDTASNYSYHNLRGNGTAAAAGAVASNTVLDQAITIAMDSTSAVGVAIIDILDYASTSKYKTTRSFNGGDLNGSGYAKLSSGSWRSTSAVTSITFGGTVLAFATTTTFALYGIKG